MKPVNKKYLLKMAFSIFFISFLTVGGCDVEFGGTGTSSGNGSIIGDIVIEGEILNFSEFGEITVTATENNFRLDRTTTDELGAFKLQFRSSSEQVTLEFEADSFDAERPNIRVVGNSTTILDITLQQNPTLISIERWQVFQDTLSLSGDTNLEFIESIVEFNIEGNGGNCIFASGTSMINYQVKSINITDLTLDDSSVEIGQTTNPINNTVTITSANQFGINAAGNSVVTINPENQCSISGGSGAVNEFASGTVGTSNCTLSL